MDPPKDPPPDLARPGDFVDPSKKPAIPSTENHPFPPSNSGDVSPHPVSPPAGDVVFGARAMDQSTLERDAASKVELTLIGQDNEKDLRRLEKTRTEKAKLEVMLKAAEQRYLGRSTTSEKNALLKQIKKLRDDIAEKEDDIEDIRARILERDDLARELDTTETTDTQRQPGESEHSFLIRTGKITPFDNSNSSANQFLPTASHVSKPGFSQSRVSSKHESPPSTDHSEDDSDNQDIVPARSTKKHKSLKGSGGSDDDYNPDTTIHPRRRKLVRKTGTSTNTPESPGYVDTESDYDIEESDYDIEESDYDIEESDYDIEEVVDKRKRKIPKDKKDKPSRLDDGDEKVYQHRLKKWIEDRRRTRERIHGQKGIELKHQDLEEWRMPHPDPEQSDLLFTGGFKLPADIHRALFPYQEVGVKWLWELHCQNVGGIVSDEMGLGKTIQMISLIAGLHHSGMLDKPCIIVAPGAVMSQWASEFHIWWPALRVAILHKSGSGMLVASEEDDYSEDDSETSAPTKGGKFAAKKIVDRVFQFGHVLITTYEGLTTYNEILLAKEWSYAVLDEGHKIRNPDANVSLRCKELKTRHRIILSGTPIQNNLTELWSLFDFVFPGKLGTLPVFREQFEVPIKIGGYKNATNTQVQTATTCAAALRDLIGPYLLRRMKIDVKSDLPKKEEKVLFCDLTKKQHADYINYLKSPQVRQLLDGGRNVLAGIDKLKKICNHPDLFDREYLESMPNYNYGKEIDSGKMIVTKNMLMHFKENGHRALLFSGSKQVLNILEKNIRSYEGFKYRRMDGDTDVVDRQHLVDEFNRDTSIDVFLLTTRVGGLGVNLTGADRVVIFDPDWNPSNDLQARERAWRIGQKKEVSVYRLITAGTIEEKMYNRQLFKQHLSQKVLSGTNSGRFFEAENVRDLFSYGRTTGGGTSTGSLFKGAETVYTPTTIRDEKEASALQSIEGVAGLENFAIADPNPRDGPGERKFIEDIFTSSGVLSSVEHDHLVGATARPSETDKYAAKVANEALQNLKRSIEATQIGPIGTLTWTGQNGTAGREAPKRASASGLLGKLKSKETSAGPSRSRTPNEWPSPQKPTTGPLRPLLERLFRSKGGSVTTDEIKVWCREIGIDASTPEKGKEMRGVLKEIAVLDKAAHTFRAKK